MIARRLVVTGALALGATSRTRAQEARPLVGFVAAAARQEKFERAFVTGLRDLGLVAGRNLDVEFRWTGGTMAPVGAAVSDLLERRAAMIVAGGGNVALTARGLTTSVPIIFATAIDPVADRLVASLARPEGNVTGLSLQSAELVPKRIQVLRDLLPAMKRLAVIYHTGSRTMAARLQTIATTATSVGLEIQDHGFKSADELESIYAAANSADAGIVLRDFVAESNYQKIVDLAARHRLPVIYEQPEAVRAGGLVSYSADFVDLHRRAAGYVARILRGAAPGDLPIEQPTRFELVINLRTARTLGLSPAELMLSYADEVIE